MADQTTIRKTRGDRSNGAQSGFPPAEAMQTSLSDFAHNIATLTELQLELTASDFRETRTKLILPAVLAVAGVGLTLSFFLLLLAGVAMLLVEQAGFTYASALLLTALLGAVLAGALLAIAWWRVRSAASIMQRSYGDLRRNLRWVLDVMKGGTRVRTKGDNR